MLRKVESSGGGLQMSREKLARCKLAKPTLEVFHVKESLAEKTFREVEKSESFSPMKRSKYLRLLSGATLKQFNPPFDLTFQRINEHDHA